MRTATEDLLRYFDACPSGKQRMKASRIHTEFPSKGRLDATTKESRVAAWADSRGLQFTSEGGVAGNPDFYTFTKKLAIILLAFWLSGCTTLYPENSPEREREHEFMEMHMKHIGR